MKFLLYQDDIIDVKFSMEIDISKSTAKGYGVNAKIEMYKWIAACLHLLHSEYICTVYIYMYLCICLSTYLAICSMLLWLRLTYVLSLLHLLTNTEYSFAYWHRYSSVEEMNNPLITQCKYLVTNLVYYFMESFFLKGAEYYKSCVCGIT